MRGYFLLHCYVGLTGHIGEWRPTDASRARRRRRRNTERQHGAVVQRAGEGAVAWALLARALVDLAPTSAALEMDLFFSFIMPTVDGVYWS